MNLLYAMLLAVACGFLCVPPCQAEAQSKAAAKGKQKAAQPAKRSGASTKATGGEKSLGKLPFEAAGVHPPSGEIYLDELHPESILQPRGALTQEFESGGKVWKHRLYHGGLGLRKSIVQYGLSYHTYKSFTGLVGCEPGAEIRRRYVIRGDGKELWSSPFLTPKDAPVPFAISIENIDLLELRGEPDRDGSGTPGGGWLDPKISVAPLSSDQPAGTEKTEEAVDERLSAPDADALRAADAQVDDTYKSAFEKATKPEAQRRLVAELSAQGADTANSPAVRFALLARALQLATDAGDVTLATQAAEVLASAFQVAASKLQAETYQTLAKSVKSAEDQMVLSGAALDAAQAAIDSADFDSAETLLDVALALAGKRKDVLLKKQVAARKSELKQQQEAAAAGAIAKKKLAQRPDDPAANLAYGKLLLQTRAWNEAWPALVKGSDPELRKLAESEMQEPTDDAARLALGDAWWQAAGEPQSATTSPLALRAVHWYKQVLPEASGLAKLRLEKRIKLAAADATPGGRIDFSKLPKVIDIPLPAGQSIRMKLVLPGKFLMGSPPESRYGGREVQHEAIITRPYYLALTELTQAQWKAVMGTNPSKRQDDPHCPVSNLSRVPAIEFLAKVNTLPGVSKYKLRLPTDAEWENAARAGTTTTYSFGDNPEELSAYGWSSQNSGKKPQPVGKLKPNAWGFFDMQGNVRELVEDVPYELDDWKFDPRHAFEEGQLTRGGSFVNNPDLCRPAFRWPLSRVDIPEDDVGFRVACYAPRQLWMRLLR